MPTKTELTSLLAEAQRRVAQLANPVANGDCPLDEGASIQQRIWWVREQRAYIEKAKLDGSDAAYTSAVAHTDLIRAVRPLFQLARVIWYPVTCTLVHPAEVSTPHGPALRAEYEWTFRFVCVDDSDDFFDVQVCSTGWSWKFDGFDKGPGKASTYADKYALLRVLGLEAGDDPDFTPRRGLETDVDSEANDLITSIRTLLKDRDSDPELSERQTCAALARKHGRDNVKNIFALPNEILREWFDSLTANG